LWVLPNLTEDCGFFESFKPFYTYEYSPVGFLGRKSAEASKQTKERKKSKEEEEENRPEEPEDESKTPLLEKEGSPASASAPADLQHTQVHHGPSRELDFTAHDLPSPLETVMCGKQDSDTSSSSEGEAELEEGNEEEKARLLDDESGML